MNISSLTKHINTIADEDFTASQITEFMNDAIARINIDCGANFPFMTVSDTEDYPGFPEKWQRMLLVPFAIGRIKQVDASQFEYSDAYGEFSLALNEFKSRYPVPTEYQDLNEAQIFEDDQEFNPWRW